jgi:hypothetical protein
VLVDLVSWYISCILFYVHLLLDHILVTHFLILQMCLYHCLCRGLFKPTSSYSRFSAHYLNKLTHLSHLSSWMLLNFIDMKASINIVFTHLISSQLLVRDVILWIYIRETVTLQWWTVRVEQVLHRFNFHTAAKTLGGNRDDWATSILACWLIRNFWKTGLQEVSKINRCVKGSCFRHSHVPSAPSQSRLPYSVKVVLTRYQSCRLI